jgi:hypothetical protein
MKKEVSFELPVPVFINANVLCLSKHIVQIWTIISYANNCRLSEEKILFASKLIAMKNDCIRTASLRKL